MLNGMMFGTLKKTLNASWRKNEDNLIITLDKEDGTHHFKIFSIYKVDYTTDYLRINFDSSEDKLDFIKMIRGRSTYKNNVEVGEDDKILTLSTCIGSNNKRLVVHAVLLKEEANEEENQ
jgi:sortase B